MEDVLKDASFKILCPVAQFALVITESLHLMDDHAKPEMLAI